ncbi:MAG: beta-ketoacyl-ACP synthase [Gemmatimonadaceae bacterium]
MNRRVAITGAAGISPLGNSWAAVRDRLKQYHNAVNIIEDWTQYEGLNSNLGAEAAPFDVPAHFDRKTTRSMGRVALMATITAEQALIDAGLLNDPIVTDGRMGIAYGSSSGSPSALAEFLRMLTNKRTEGINATTYIKMMSHTAAVNIGVYLGVKGRVIPTSSACTSGSQGVGYAYEAVKSGKQVAMIAGGAEELDVTQVAIFDTLFATSVKNSAPNTTPRPFDCARDGLVLGEGAGTLILEEYEHAVARGARIYAEIVGFGTNSDGTHITRPNSLMMQAAMRLALEDAALPPEAVGYVNGHGTATDHGDIAESQATLAVFGSSTPISSLKSYMGHTLGACGSLEAWMSVEMMRDDWFAPTLNLTDVDPRCAPLDYIVGEGRRVQCEYVASNNFAFGGINTSLVFKRV